MSHVDGSELQSGLVEALQNVARQLQDISQRLPSAVSTDSLSKGNNADSDRDASNPNHANVSSASQGRDIPASSDEHDKHEDKDYEDQTLLEEQEQLWTATKSDLQEQSKTNIEGWKDEMNNLLIFAGLFSAVVTAFTVESYKWLQPTPDDNSDLYLAHISRQLSSFTVAPTVINSSTSAAALPPEGAQSFFSPIAIPVNTLWVLSLTLSLLSAFFAIAVQQWLRQQRVPPDIPVRKAVQLLSLRYSSLQSWQVPGIISLLPLLLQSAVVLFLAGLFLLLRMLNRTVTTAFVTVAAIGLLAFLITTIVPLVNFSCPYKSPLLPTTLLVFEWFLKVFPLLLFILGYPFMAFLRSKIGTKLLYLFRIWIQYHAYLDAPYANLLHWIKTFEVVDVTRFWTTCEHLYLTSLNELGIKDLENRSIAHVFISTGSNKFANITRGLRAFGYQEWHSIVCRAVVQSINVVLPSIEWKDIIGGGPPALQPRVRPYLLWMSFRHHRLLWRLLQQRDWIKDDAVSQTDGEVLTLFHNLDSTISDTQHALKSASLISDTQHVYLRYLLDVCDKQRFASSWQCFSYETIPGCLALHLTLESTHEDGNPLEKEDVLRIQRYFDKCLFYSQSLRRKADKNTVKVLLAAATSVLTLANSTFHVPLASVSQILREVDGFVTKPPTALSSSSSVYDPLSDEALLIRNMLRSQHDDANEGSRGDYMSASLIVRNLCKALMELASSRRVLRDPDCSSLSVTNTLRTILSEIHATDAMHARDHLDAFASFVPHGGNMKVWRKQVEQDDRMDNILEQGMQAQLLVEKQEALLGRMHESEPLNALMEQAVKAQISAEKREEALHDGRPDMVLAQVIEAQVAAEKREARRGHTMQVQLPDVPLEESMEALILASQREEGSLDQENSPVTPDPDHPRSRSPFVRHDEPNNIARDALPGIQTQNETVVPDSKLVHERTGDNVHGEAEPHRDQTAQPPSHSNSGSD